jgi:hypothetical protein
MFTTERASGSIWITVTNIENINSKRIRQCNDIQSPQDGNVLLPERPIMDSVQHRA